MGLAKLRFHFNNITLIQIIIMNESLENIEPKPVDVPQGVKTLAILSYIGNAFWGLAIFAVLMWALVSPDGFARFITQGSEDRLYIEPMGILVGMIIGITICILPIFGAAMMSKGKKSGFWLFLVPNILWVILNFSSRETPNVVIALITVGFIVGFAVQLKQLR